MEFYDYCYTQERSDNFCDFCDFCVPIKIPVRFV